jgi:hypothetical protein
MCKSRPKVFRGRHFRDDIIVLCVRWLAKGDVIGQVRFIDQTFGLLAA